MKSSFSQFSPTSFLRSRLIRSIVLAPGFCLFLLLLSTSACKKKDQVQDIPLANQQLRAAFEANIISHDHYQLVQYFSKVPIDYIDTDAVVKQETDLWPYVSEWLIDDWYHFTKSVATCYQNSLKNPSNSAETITQNFNVYADLNGVGMHFMNHEYVPLEYRIDVFSDTDFTVHAFYKNHIVYSRFRVVP